MRKTAFFRSDATRIVNQGEIVQFRNEAHAKIEKRLQAFTNDGTGWMLNRCERLDLGIVQYQPFRGQTPAYIPLPAVINVKKQRQLLL